MPSLPEAAVRPQFFCGLRHRQRGMMHGPGPDCPASQGPPIGSGAVWKISARLCPHFLDCPRGGTVRRMAGPATPAGAIAKPAPPSAILAITAPCPRGRAVLRPRPGYRTALRSPQQASHRAWVAAGNARLAFGRPWLRNGGRHLNFPNIIYCRGSRGSTGSTPRRPAVFCGFLVVRHGTPNRFTRGSRGSGQGHGRIRGSEGRERSTWHRHPP